MSIRPLTVPLCAALLSNFVPSFGPEASAATAVTLRVPASACEPETALDRELLELTNGSWVFSGIEEGSVTLWCPVTLSIGDPVFPDRIENMRLWYRDPSGMNSSSSVTAQLQRRGASSASLTAIGVTMTSDSSSSTTNNRIAQDFTNHTLTDSLYFVQVTITRDEQLESVAFHGVDFTLDLGS